MDTDSRLIGVELLGFRVLNKTWPQAIAIALRWRKIYPDAHQWIKFSIKDSND